MFPRAKAKAKICDHCCLSDVSKPVLKSCQPNILWGFWKVVSLLGSNLLVASGLPAHPSVSPRSLKTRLLSKLVFLNWPCKCESVWLSVCVIALWWTGDLYRVSPASHPLSAGIGLSQWMDWKLLAPFRGQHGGSSASISPYPLHVLLSHQILHPWIFSVVLNTPSPLSSSFVFMQEQMCTAPCMEISSWIGFCIKCCFWDNLFHLSRLETGTRSTAACPGTDNQPNCHVCLCCWL